ncbi:MAG TPA: hypothetical protein VF746_14630 [Longimicrobium sp.]
MLLTRVPQIARRLFLPLLLTANVAACKDEDCLRRNDELSKDSALKAETITALTDSVSRLTRKVEGLRQRAELIHAVHVTVSISGLTASDSLYHDSDSTSLSVNSLLVLTRQDGAAYRFTNIPRAEPPIGQARLARISDGRYQLTLSYEPEDPVQLLGDSVGVLAEVKTLQLDHSWVLPAVGLGVGPATTVDVTVVANGISAVQVQVPLSPDVTSYDVTGAFSQASVRYRTGLDASINQASPIEQR